MYDIENRLYGEGNICMKQKIKQMLPVLIIISMMLIMSSILYYKVMERETDKCWTVLRDSAQSATKEIQMTFEDNINILHLIKKELLQENKIRPDEVRSFHLESFRENTFFSRIDVIYPDDRVLLEDGTMKKLRKDTTFEQIAAKGECVSQRMTDTETGDESVYYYVPISQNGKIVAILSGVVDTATLTEALQLNIYNGQAKCCIVDSTDGNYIMDNWHPKLGNAFNTTKRKRLKGYESVDLKKEIKNLNTGVIAFISRTNGLGIYMYYMPVGFSGWELLVFAQEDVIFANLLYLRNLLIIAGVIEIALLLIYFLWNLHAVNQLTKSKAETVKQLEISNTLIQCVTELSSTQDINISIRNLLQIINDYFKSDRTYIFERDMEKDIFVNTYEYARDGVVPQLENMPEIPVSALSRGMESFEKHHVYHLLNVEEEKSSITYDILRERDIYSLIAVPFWENGIVTGFVSVDNPKQNNNDIKLLTSIPFFIMNSLSTKKQQKQLRVMSYRDSLTTLYNRNRYIQVLEACSESILKKTGVAYIDLNGLKRVNDEEGHEAGDTLIRNAAEVIADIFPEVSYRIGGDEFVIICVDVEQEQFIRNIDILREQMKRKKVSISIGTLWVLECDDLEELLKQADQYMYEDKKRYYQRQKLKV